MVQYEKLTTKLELVYKEIIRNYDLQKSYLPLISRTVYSTFKVVFKKAIAENEVIDVNKLMHIEFFGNIDNDLFDALKYEFALELCHKSTISVLLGDHLAQRYLPQIIKIMREELYSHCTEKIFDYLGLDLHNNTVAHHRTDVLQDVKHEFYEEFKKLRVA